MTAGNGREFNPREFFIGEKFGPSKTLGQNFIIDRRVIERIVEIAQITEKDEVLEIGPGLGALTFTLAARAGRVVVIEKDKKLAARMEQYIGEYANIELVCADSLDVDFRDFYIGKKIKVISNLPFSVSSPILIKLLNDIDIFSFFLLMLQREVGDRISAAPGGKNYGSLSVLLQTYMDVKLEFRVPPSAFWPKPKVESVVLKLTPLKAPRVSIDDRAIYEKVIRASFSSRRKMLGNSLKSILPKGTVDNVLESAGIERSRRAETLTIEEFGALYREVEALAEM